jgi:hypothetical protein
MIKQTSKPLISRRTLLFAGSLTALAGAAVWAVAPTSSNGRTAVTLYKNPECQCCEGYADYLRGHGFTVTVKLTNDLAQISRKAGVPSELQGCHTAFIGDYVVDGHVPFEAVQKLLADHPAIKGITLPGMPAGSPGMSGKKEGQFTIYAIDKDGKSSVYMKI